MPAFIECTALSDRALDEQYDMELALRFLVFRRMPEPQLKGLGDLGDFLTEAATALAENKKLNRQEEELAFATTFSILQKELGSDPFRRYDALRNRFVGGFSVSAYEAVGLGLGFNYKAAPKIVARIRERIQALWSAPEFTESSGSGITASRRIPKILPYARRLFRP